MKGNALINMLITLTKFTPAIKYYDKALAKTLMLPISYNRCLSFLHLEKYNESLKVFEKVLSIDPNDASSLYNKGISLDKLGNHTQGISTSISESIKKEKGLDERNSFNSNMTIHNSNSKY